MQSQISMTVPYGSFEQWTSHQGYNVTMMGMNLPVYEEYSTPTGWDYLLYPVNESISVYGSTINVNTMLPLIKVSQETGTVPDGSKAVKLQTFMLSDIVSGLVYVMAASQLDPTLTQTVYPSILSTGAANIDSLLPLVTTLLSSTGDLLGTLLPLASRDINDLITGGIPLGGYTPLQLSGSYKYHSGEGSDNGGVVILGTRYDPATHQRHVVGGGINTALTDINSYTPFSVDYLSLHQLDSTIALQTPDSLIVMLISSANNNRAQGSWLCIDNLILSADTTAADTTVVTPTDTCAGILWIEAATIVFDAFPQYELQWWGSSQPDHWEVEYGPQGFEYGTGTVVTTNESTFPIYELEEQGILQPNTWYDFYVRSVCDSGIYGQWDSVHYRTFCATVNGLTVSADGISVTPNGLVEGYTATWTDTTATQQWVVSYGKSGSSNSSTPVYVSEPSFSLPPLVPNTQYCVTVSPLCGDDNYGDQRWVYFTTANVGIAEVEVISLSINPNPADGRCIVTLPDNMSAELKLYGTDGRLIQVADYTGAPLELLLPSKGVYLLQATTPKGTITRKIVCR